MRFTLVTRATAAIEGCIGVLRPIGALAAAFVLLATCALAQ